MKQDERRKWLIRKLFDENMHYREYEVPDDIQEQKDMLRSLMNVRMPKDIDEEFLAVQDAYLQQVQEEKGVVTLEDMEEL